MTKSRPDGWHTITPRLFVKDIAGLVKFLKTVFNARGEMHASAPSEIKIGDSIVLISDGGIREPMPAFLYLYLEDTDATYKRAMAAGAQSIEPPRDLHYGDRRATVRDPWGNIWQIATYRGP